MIHCSKIIQPRPLPSDPSSDGSDQVVAIYSDILRTHVLTRLDGSTLATVGCASSELYEFAADQSLWRKICTSTWPSVSDPRVSHVISTLPCEYRSFFSDSCPVIHYHYHTRQRRRCSGEGPTTPVAKSGPLISAVDIHYKGVAVLSKVAETDTRTRWFQSSPFRVDILECKEFAHEWAPPVSGKTDTWLDELEANLKLSWLVVNPETGRSMNVASQLPVSAHRHWLTGEVQLKFAVVIAGGENSGGTEREYVECGVVVTCGGREGGEVHVREVCLGVEDLDGRGVCGRDSLVILLGAMEGGERKRRGGSEVVGEEGKRRFEEFKERKEDWEMRKMRMEKVLDLVSVVGGVLVVLPFWSWLFGVFY